MKGAPRRYDWDEARRLRGEGWTFTALAAHFGVSEQAVRNAALDEEWKRNKARVTEWRRAGVCVDCGGPANRDNLRAVPRCRACEKVRRLRDVPTAVRLPFYSDCVTWPTELLAVLEHLIDNGHEVSVGWFARHVNMVGAHGYWPLAELVAAARRGVHGTSFYRLPGQPVFWLVNSSIEYVFAEPQTIRNLVPLVAC